MNKKDILEKIRLYKIDLSFCKESSYNEVASELETKIKLLESKLSEVKHVSVNRNN